MNDKGTFLPFQLLDAAPNQFQSFHDAVPADLDGDGDLDFVRIYPVGSSQWVYFNDGSATFPRKQAFAERPLSNVTTGISTRMQLDIAAGAVSHIVVYVNNGGGHFTAGPDIPTNQSSFRSIAVGDVDNDGDLDSGRRPILLNNGLGRLVTPESTHTEQGRLHWAIWTATAISISSWAIGFNETGRT